MTWTYDNLGRQTLARSAFRAVAIGGRPREGEPLLIANRPPRPVVHLRIGRTAPDDEHWAAMTCVGDVDPAERLREDHDTLWFPDTLGREHRFYERPDGSLEHEIVLPREPDGLVVPFAVASSPGVRWHWQGPLSQLEIDEGAEGPDDVVDSWAVYAPASGNYRLPDGRPLVEYETGKLGHLYRPTIDDGRGPQWAEWVIEHGLPAGIRVPAGLRYPSVLGPTFGLTTSGAGGRAIYPDLAHAYQPSSNPEFSGTLDYIRAWLTNTSGYNLKAAIYADNGGSWGGAALLTSGAAPATAGLSADSTPLLHTWTYVSKPAVAADTPYWLALMTDRSSLFSYMRCDSGSGHNENYKAGQTYADFPTNPAPSSPTSYGAAGWSIYGEYTVSGGGATPWLYAHRRSARIVQ